MNATTHKPQFGHSESPKEYYDSIADRYDWFLDSWEDVTAEQMQRIVPLLRDHGAVRILDCACGTGLQVIALAKLGFDVIGSDLSPKMLEQAHERCVAEGMQLPLIEADIRTLRERVDETFDAVVCIGNVLPHLDNDAEVITALENLHAALEPGGLLVLEGRYYDDLLMKKSRFLVHRANGEEDGKLVTILYVLDFHDDKIAFNILFIVDDRRGEPHLHVETVDYNPITTDELRALLTLTNFGEIELNVEGDRYLCTAIATPAQISETNGTHTRNYENGPRRTK